MRWLFGAGAAVIMFFPVAANAEAAAKCDQAAFTAVVSETGARLSTLNETNKRAFQNKLQALKTRESWADNEYVAKASPFVRDETITAFDETNNALLAKVPQLGGNAPGAAKLASVSGNSAPDDKNCRMLGELRGLMAQVIDNTRAKWSYMLVKLDTAAASSPRQAKAGQ